MRPTKYIYTAVSDDNIARDIVVQRVVRLLKEVRKQEKLRADN